MPDYRRNRIAGGTYFFTVNLRDRTSHLLVDQIHALRSAVRRVRAERPFQIHAWVVLPDHLHCIWTLPEGDGDYSTRWRAIKSRFTKAIGTPGTPIWQRRFWERTIRTQTEFNALVDYIHVNPQKHGWVTRVIDWPYSTFHRYVARGVYPKDWAGESIPNLMTGERKN